MAPFTFRSQQLRKVWQYIFDIKHELINISLKQLWEQFIYAYLAFTKLFRLSFSIEVDSRLNKRIIVSEQ